MSIDTTKYGIIGSLIYKVPYLHGPLMEYITLQNQLRLSLCPHKVKTQYLLILKHSRYIHLMSNFLSIQFHTERLYVHMFDTCCLQLWKRIDRLLITSRSFLDKGKYSACDLKCRYCIFTCGAPLPKVGFVYKHSYHFFT